MVGLISSEKVVIGLVVGIPLIVVALIVASTYPRIPRAVTGAAVVVAVLLVAVALWAAFRPEGATVASGAQLASLPENAVTGPSAPAAGPPTTQAPPEPACSPGGTTVEITARAVAFDKDCLAAPADTAFSLAFDNQDPGVPHNVEIFRTPAASERLGGAKDAGDFITGPDQVTYQVSALPAGTYFFRCDLHPAQMHGDFVVA
jgi:plastocyanin